VDAAACAVGRLGPDGPWIGFAPTLDGGYALVVADAARARSAPAGADDLLALAIAYFTEELDEAPETFAATHGDIGALVRHVAEHELDDGRRHRLGEAVDAVDDGLAADVVVGRLARCLTEDEDAGARLRRRALEL
jgi:hypothetical protein